MDLDLVLLLTYHWHQIFLVVMILVSLTSLLMILEPDTREILTVVGAVMVELGPTHLTLLSNVMMELGKFLSHLAIPSVSCQETSLHSLQALLWSQNQETVKAGAKQSLEEVLTLFRFRDVLQHQILVTVHCHQ